MNFWGSEYELTTGTAVTPAAFVLAIFLPILLVILSYITYRSKGRLFWVLPAVVRVLALILLGICIAQPTLKSTRKEVIRGRVSVILDVSKSMSLPDMPGGVSRHEKARRILFGPDAKLLKRLNARFQTTLYEFAEQVVRPVQDDPRALDQPQGPATRIGEALRHVVSKRERAPLAAIVILSDGQDNSADNVPEIARSCSVPVYAVGIGTAKKKEKIRDLALADVRVEKTVLVNSRVIVQVSVISRGIRGVVPVTLSSAGKKVANTLAKVTPGAKDTVRLEFVPKTVGQFIYTITIPVKKGELTAENNRASFTLRVIDKSFHVLYIEGAWRWEYRFLRRALLEDRDVELDCYLRSSQNNFYHQPPPGRKRTGTSKPEHRRSLPLSQKELEKVDLVIFGDIERKMFSDAQLAAIKAFVYGRGGAFLMLGGKSSFASGGYINTPIEDILPVKLKPKGDLQSSGEFRPVLTPEGLRHPILQLDPDLEINKAIWAGLPHLSGSNRTGGKKPGATVLMVRRSVRRIQAPDIILAVQRYGKGKTAALTVDTTWRWGFQALGTGGDASAYQNFWAQMVRWLMPDPETDLKSLQAVRVTTDKTDYRQVDTVHIEARILNEDGSPAKQAQVSGTLTTPSGGASPITIKPSSAPGVYTAVYKPRAVGPYQVSVKARIAGRLLGTDTAGFLVGEATLEMQNTDVNTELLRSVAENSNGKYVIPDEAESIVPLIPDVRKERIRTSRVRLWNSPVLLAAFIIIATAEWLIRRYAIGW